MLAETKPRWLNKKIIHSACRDTRKLLRGLGLRTVCEESLCPNISECFGKKVATFMILGVVCTRGCAFCGVTKDKRPKEVDLNEPLKIKEAVQKLRLNYIVITSPTRDDLFDGGASAFCRTVKEIKSISLQKRVELLIPDFKENLSSIEKVVFSGAEVIAHNVETVPSLYIKVRRGADYRRSLNVLSRIKGSNSKLFVKSGIMLGLGEKEKEVKNVLEDLKSVGCDFVTIGQYLPPSLEHTPLKEYVAPEVFNHFKEYAFSLGFMDVKSAPYVRSSYLAHSFFCE